MPAGPAGQAKRDTGTRRRRVGGFFFAAAPGAARDEMRREMQESIVSVTANPSVGRAGSLAGVPPRALRVALLGFGTVGQSVARILVERPELASHLELTHVFNRGVSRKRAEWVPSAVTWTE